MSVSTPTQTIQRPRRLRARTLTIVAAAILAAGGWGLAQAFNGGTRPAAEVNSSASVLASLSPANRRYVQAITALSDKQIAADFGDEQPTTNVLASLSPANRRYVQAITALSDKQIAADFGNGR